MGVMNNLFYKWYGCSMGVCMGDADFNYKLTIK